MSSSRAARCLWFLSCALGQSTSRASSSFQCGNLPSDSPYTTESPVSEEDEVVDDEHGDWDEGTEGG